MLIIGYIFSWISRKKVDHKFEHINPKLTQSKMYSTDRKLTQKLTFLHQPRNIICNSHERHCTIILLNQIMTTCVMDIKVAKIIRKIISQLRLRNKIKFQFFL